MTDLQKVRLLTNDTDVANQQFADTDIEAFLEMEGSVYGAAALALETIAVNETLVLKRIEILDLKTDGPAVSKALMDTAARWRTRADEGTEDDDDFAIAEMVVDAHTFAERVFNEGLRDAT